MFGIGFTELLVIAIVALVIFGPKRLPDVMKQAGRLFVQVRRTANDVRSTFDGVVRDAEQQIRREEEETRRTLLAESRPVATTPVPSPTAATGGPAPSAPAAAGAPDSAALTPDGSRPTT